MVGAEETGVTGTDIVISRASLRHWLFSAWLVVALLGLGAELARHLLNTDPGNHWLWLFSLSQEGNIPTWYSSSLLAVSAVLLVLATLEAQHANAEHVWHWGFMAVVMAYISMDEFIGFHEHADWIDGKGIFHFSWVIPGAIVVATLGLVYLRFLLRLPGESRRAFLVAGLVYVGGALGVELVLGLWTETHGTNNLGYGLIDFVEESMEILGVTLFVLALVDHLHGAAGAMGITLRRRP
jgi:hypothetical protein